MKKAIILAVKYLGFGLLVTVLTLSSLVLFVAMPDILRWVASYIGSLMTYGLFISGLLLFFAWCINHNK